MCLQFGFVIFWRKDFGTKAAHKMLVKLTPGFCLVAIIMWSQFNLPFLNRFTKGLRAGFVRDQVKETPPTFNFFDLLKKWAWHDKDFLIQTCGETGFEYLTFQRYIAGYQSIVCIFGLGIFLPLHLCLLYTSPSPRD